MTYKTKFEEGQRKLEKAGNDKDLLESALLSFHGALEDYLREKLSVEIERFQEETGKPRAGWVDLVNLWEKHRYLSTQDRSYILATNSKRNEAAHGYSIPITRSEVEKYAQFVQKLMGIRRSPFRRPVSSVPRQSTSNPQDQGIITDVSYPATSIKRFVGWIGPTSWIIIVALLLLAAFATFSIWNDVVVSLLLTAVLFFFLRRRQWWRSGYTYVGGLAFGYAQSVLGLSLVLAFVAALCWPLSGGALYLYNRADGDVNPENLLESSGVEEFLDDNGLQGNLSVDDDFAPEEVDATAVATPLNPEETENANQLEVIGNSNVRTEPNIEAEKVGVALEGERYEILETSDDNNWYKIRLSDGQEGWIGSTRITRQFD